MGKRTDVEQAAQVTDLPPATIDFAHRMFDAAREGNAELLLQAVDAGLPANLTNDGGNTLLMLAAYAGHADLVRGLVERGADPNRLNDRGQSPVAGAVFKGSDDVVRVLMEGGADPRGGTPNAIQTARMFGKTGLLSVLGAQEGEGTEAPVLPAAASA
ncbi:ankyrin [Dentipellis sp. KUC8613]|nr:ankyrin [Dentipellis sp. KUC8613]